MNVFDTVAGIQLCERNIKQEINSLEAKLIELNNEKQDILQTHLRAFPDDTENERYVIKSRKNGGRRKILIDSLEEAYPYKDHPELYELKTTISTLEQHLTDEQINNICEVSPVTYSYRVEEKDSMKEAMKRMKHEIQ